MIQNTTGTHGRLGGIYYEKNHSSVLAHISVKLTGTLAELLIQLLDRKMIISFKINKIIATNFMKMKNFSYQMKQRNQNDDLNQVAQYLCI